MLTTGILLVILDILLLQLVGNIFIFRATLALLLITVFAYDYWDYLRIHEK